MNNKLYDALEDCLQALEQGQKIDPVLARYPNLDKELRPLLETSLHARTMSGEAVPGDIQRRGRSRLLQRAAEMREAKTSKRRVIPIFPRMAVTLGLAGILALISTGLVSASSGALPGDQLYPVKRTWEGVRLSFVFSPASRELLESQYEQERLDEIDELLAQRRSTQISFSGLVTKQQDGQWLVSGIPVLVNAMTRLPAPVPASGVPVMVIGSTSGNGVVEASEIRLLAAGASLPPLQPSDERGRGGELENENSAPTSIFAPTPGTPAPELETKEDGQKPQPYEFSGVVKSMQGNVWNINGQTVLVGQAEISGNVQVGSIVEFEGYYDADGNFVVTKIEVQSGGDSSKGDKSGSGSGGDNQNTNENTNDDTNTNSNDNNNDNDNENDH